MRLIFTHFTAHPDITLGIDVKCFHKGSRHFELPEFAFINCAVSIVVSPHQSTVFLFVPISRPHRILSFTPRLTLSIIENPEQGCWNSDFRSLLITEDRDHLVVQCGCKKESSAVDHAEEGHSKRKLKPRIIHKAEGIDGRGYRLPTHPRLFAEVDLEDLTCGVEVNGITAPGLDIRDMHKNAAQIPQILTRTVVCTNVGASLGLHGDAGVSNKNLTICSKTNAPDSPEAHRASPSAHRRPKNPACISKGSHLHRIPRSA
ncbi:MAG: hypothetical protein BWY82_01743 [Verrucomicrobia bacterium ADurb.Bin474]|nr:MAG: hypothetical protein BWY82_01743 [Verrucomicrobia bacterium ADurb.Bin474]